MTNKASANWCDLWIKPQQLCVNGEKLHIKIMHILRIEQILVHFNYACELAFTQTVKHPNDLDLTINSTLNPYFIWELIWHRVLIYCVNCNWSSQQFVISTCKLYLEGGSWLMFFFFLRYYRKTAGCGRWKNMLKGTKVTIHDWTFIMVLPLCFIGKCLQITVYDPWPPLWSQIPSQIFLCLGYQGYGFRQV